MELEYSWYGAGIELGLLLELRWGGARMQLGWSWAAAGMQLRWSWDGAGVELGLSWEEAMMEPWPSHGFALGFWWLGPVMSLL